MDMMGKIMASISFILILIVISIVDIKQRKIYNEAVAALFVPAIVSFFVFPEVSLTSRLLGAILISGMMLLVSLIRPGAFGGGDIKMMVPVGFMLGAEAVWKAWLIAVFMAAGYSLCLLAARKHKRIIPFGPFLCLGSALVFGFLS